MIASFSACRVVGRCLYICVFKSFQRKNHKVISQVTSLGGHVMSPRKDRKRPGNSSLRTPSKRRQGRAVAPSCWNQISASSWSSKKLV
ncbi:hypothetical protein TNCT_226801 [Trichonephila clavata]|uniref:Uncharacterized protein n=1 Tax=Trichonephila clavata TaxID=2740835 RepID=A0A8X6M6J4_TRICU|nr:hypothetical protein TNCT_226801 [Trichonephila clavata]